MTALNAIFAVVGWAWLAVVVVAAFMIHARRRAAARAGFDVKTMDSGE